MSNAAKPKIAIMWARFGPYHLARLRGAARALGDETLIGLEIASADRDYAWSLVHGGEGFERVTVFPDQNYHDLSPRQLAAGVKRTLDRIRPDLIAINGWGVPEARAALRWARQNGAATVLMSESKADDRARPWWKEKLKSALVRRFDAALVGGRRQVDYLVGLGFAKDRIRLGYDAIDNAYFEAGADAARANNDHHRAALGLPSQYFFVCTRFLARKNVDGLLRAYALYRSSSADPWSLVIAGSGEREESLRRLAAALHLDDLVSWPGFVQYPELPRYFALAGAFVHPAKSEAWGLVVNEAAACATPLLVARPVGAAAELLREGDTGLSFDPEDVADIARALREASAADETQRKRWGANARALVAHWGPDRFGAELAELAARHLKGATREAHLAGV